MTNRIFIDEDGDACLAPSGRDKNLVALPARDDDGSILNPEAWQAMVDAYNAAFEVWKCSEWSGFADACGANAHPTPQADAAPCPARDGSGDASDKGRIEACCPCKGTGKAPSRDEAQEAVHRAWEEGYEHGRKTARRAALEYRT